MAVAKATAPEQISVFFSSRRRHTSSYGDWSSDVCSSDLLPDAQDVEARDPPDDAQDEPVLRHVPEREEGGAVDHSAHRRDARGEDVVDHDRRDGDEGGDRPEHEVREGVDAASAEVVVLQDLRDLDEAGREHRDEQRGADEEEDRLRPDEAMGLGGGVEDRGELVHQGDEPDGEPGEVPLAALGEAEEAPAHRERDEYAEQAEVQPEEDEERHASSSAAKRPSRAATDRKSVG